MLNNNTVILLIYYDAYVSLYWKYNSYYCSFLKILFNIDYIEICLTHLILYNHNM